MASPPPASSHPLATAADAARQGYVAYFDSLPPATLASVASGLDDDGRSLVHSAALGGDAALLKRLLAVCPPEHAALADEAGWTPLICASSAGKRDTVAVLLEAGASANAKTRAGRTPLHYAASKNRPEVITLLLAAGADPAAADELGDTPLHRAAGAGGVAATRALLAAGVAPAPRNKTRDTPLHAACAAGAGGPAALLVAAAGDDARKALESVNAAGEMPLELAGESLARTLVAVAQGEVDVEEEVGLC